MNELDLTNTQSIILLLIMVVMLLLLKRMESHRRSDIKQVEETPSDELNPYYGCYIQLGMVGESEQDLAHGILDLVEKYHKVREIPKPRLTGLMSAKEVMEELDIKYKTLQKWEENGLRRYQPEIEDTRKVYYKITDILKFLGVENG